MKSTKLFVPIFVGLVTFSLASCSGGVESSKETLRILNWEDYIYEPESEEDEPSIVDQFINYIKEIEDKDIEVIYDTFDTNETMFSSLKTGKSTYDLICPSDYMIQKMIAQDMLEPFDVSQVANYDTYASPYLKNIFNNIFATTTSGEQVPISNYACGYMWGTLGIIYNPNYEGFSEDLSPEQVDEDMTSWDVLWNEKYNQTISIKDSMRDTYSIGVMKVYQEEFTDLLNSYKNNEISTEDYNASLTAIFNRCDDDTLALVKTELLNLKNNIFGFEVDSGKEDIVTGKVGINTAWSGDAVYAIGVAKDENDIELHYSIPETGGNIWFDGWVMPKSDSLNKDLALKFLNFISNPEMAAKNMNYIGYTSFIGGDVVLELIRDWYDARKGELYSTDENTGEYLVDDEGNYISKEGMEDITYSNFPQTSIDEKINDGSWHSVDLSYFFDNTLDEYTNDVDTIFYSDEYNGQFATQYPDSTVIPRLAIMADFGTRSSYVLDMWEIVKSNSLEPWAIVLFSAEIIGTITLLSYVLVKSFQNKSRRKKRRLERTKV